MRIRRLSLLGVAALAVLAGVPGGATAAARTAPPSALVSHTVAGLVQDVSCPSASVCYALTHVDKQTRWGVTRIEDRGASVHTTLISAKRNAVAISCPSTAGCEVFGFSLSNAKPLIYPVSKAGVPGNARVVTGSRPGSLNAIACSPTRADCTLVGAVANVVNIVTVKGPKITTRHVTLPKSTVAGAIITDLSCPSSTFCEAVGMLFTHGGKKVGFVLPIHHGVGGNWTSVANATGGFSSVACPSTGHCYAVGNTASRYIVESMIDGTFAHTLAKAGVVLREIACTSSHSCDAVGSYKPKTAGGRGLILAVDGGTPGKATLTSMTHEYSTIAGYKGGFLAAGPATAADSLITSSS
jgi:hypothetical protein